MEYSDSDDDESRPIPSPISVIGDDPSDPDLTETEETADNDDASDEDSDAEEENGRSRNTDDHDQSVTTDSQQLLPWFGFKIIGDNIDKNVRASFQRSDHGTISLHHFHAFASRDRLDLSSLSDKDPDLSTVIGDIDAEDFLPNQQDIDKIKEEFCILITGYILIVL
jgi:L1 cell adhesion molecule like protein